MKFKGHIAAISLIILILIVPIAQSLTYDQKINTVTQTITNVPYYYVENNTSDIDSSADKGSHSNFTAQQQSPDSSFDILTEEDTLGFWGNYSSELLINSGAEFGNTTGWTATGPNAANFVAGYDCPSGSAGPNTGSYAFYWNNPSSSNDWTYQEIDLSPWLTKIQAGEAQITAKGWLVCSEYHVPPWDIFRMKVVFYENSTQEISSDTYDTGERGDLQAWTEFGIENYTIPTNADKVRVWFQTYENNWDAGNADDFTVKIRTYTTPRNYELDLEAQWTNVDYHETNEELCINFNGEANWLSGWSKRVNITIDHNKIESSLSNFPVLLYLSNSSGRFDDDLSFVFDELQIDANRKKIAVTASDGLTQCYVEIEKWDNVNKQAWLWVKAPSINNVNDTVLYFYYDVNQTDNANYVGDTGSIPAENVWDSNYDMVLHLDEISGDYQDSTSNTKDASVTGSPNRGVTGKVYDAIEFTNTANQYVKTSTKLDTTDAFTIELWANLTNTGTYQTVFYQGKSGSWQELFTISSAGQVMSWFRNGDYGKSYAYYWNYGEFHHVVIVYDGSAIEIYEDGVSAISPVTTDCNSADPQYWHIGGRDDAAQPLDGVVDEHRFSKTNRSSAWIKASYESGRDDLLDFGSEETRENIQVDVWTGSEWQNVFPYLTTGWNNVTVTSYLTASTFTIRFKGANESNDAIQDSWAIDATLLHAWT